MNKEQNETNVKEENQVEDSKSNQVEREEKDNTKTDSTEDVNTEVENKEENKEEKEPTVEEQLKEFQGKFVRLYADFENYRKRTNKEKVDLLSSASAGVVKDMLTVLDDFERAIANNENVEDPQALKEGFSLIYNKFKGVLEGKGLKPMDAKGKEFDSELHEAVANMPTEDKDQKGKVIDDVEKGYYLNDKVIRFAKVVVGQ